MPVLVSVWAARSEAESVSWLGLDTMSAKLKRLMPVETLLSVAA